MASLKELAPERTSTFRRMTEKLANAVFNSRFARFCCCIPEEVYHDLQHDTDVRVAVKDELETFSQATEYQCISVAAEEVYNESGYALTGDVAEDDEENYKEYVGFAEFLATPHTFEEWEAFTMAIQGTGFTYDMAPGILKLHKAPRRVKISPKFIAASVMALRAKLQRLELDKPNQTTVEMEYGRIMRNGNVRACVADPHRAFVVNAYFTQSDAERVATSRTRAPKWLRRSLGYDTPMGVPQAC